MIDNETIMNRQKQINKDQSALRLHKNRNEYIKMVYDFLHFLAPENKPENDVREIRISIERDGSHGTGFSNSRSIKLYDRAYKEEREDIQSEIDFAIEGIKRIVETYIRMIDKER